MNAIPLSLLSALLMLLMVFPHVASAQDTIHLGLDEVVELGMNNSKALHLSASRVDEAMAQFQQARDAGLPDVSIGLSPSEAFILTRKLHIGELMKDTLYTPDRSTLYMWSLNINEPIFAGHKLKYARESANLLHQIAGLNAQNDSEDVRLDLIISYINLYTIDEGRKIAAEELRDVQGRLDETQQFRDNGLATDNDVLRFKLQKAEVSLRQIDLENNRAVANYAMDILLGLPEDRYIQVDSVGHSKSPEGLEELLSTALRNRKELSVYEDRLGLSDMNIKKIKDGQLPTLGAGVKGSWINPSSAFIPPKYSSLSAVILGLNLSWNISSLYTYRHRMEEAKVQQRQVEIGKLDEIDKIKTDVQRQYRNYLQSVEKIGVLVTAVEQAKENDRVMELKYQNQLAPTTDRIDAQTLLYQSLVNLSVAHADATTAYYQLLRSVGSLAADVNLNNQ